MEPSLSYRASVGSEDEEARLFTSDSEDGFYDKKGPKIADGWSPRWFIQRTTKQRRQMTRIATALLVFISLFYVYVCGVPFYSAPSNVANISVSLQDTPRPFVLPSLLPQIPAKVWQVYLAFAPDALKPGTITSFVSHSPTTSYVVLDNVGAEALIDHVSTNYPGYERVRPLYDAMSRTVIRADFLRFLVLAVEGGAYSDADTEMVRPVGEWVPEELRAQTRLIVGLEADALDSEQLIGGTSYRVQFCQWTMAGAKGHSVFWTMVDRILDKIEERIGREHGQYISNDDVLDIGGPKGWTEVIYEHLSYMAGEPVTWSDLTGMTEPKFYGDTLVLPIDGFATGAPHSNASPVENKTDHTMVLHWFRGTWKGWK